MSKLRIANPWLEQFRSLRKDPNRQDWDTREYYAHRFSWSVPTQPALDDIKQFSPQGLVEIGAGTGYWASLLRAMGVDVIAYDLNPVEMGDNQWHGSPLCTVPFQVKSFTEVLYGDATAAAMHAERALMLCWPPKHSAITHETASMSDRALACYKGDRLVYVGQEADGCTGSETFHQMLADEWMLVRKKRLLNFRGVKDGLYLYLRKPKTQTLLAQKATIV